jgi:hypothetical protein
MKTKLLFCLVFAVFFNLGSTYGQVEDCLGQFKTFTIGGWGTACHGGNPGCYRDANFAGAFPAGLTIGCGSNTISLTSTLAVQNFLPSGGTPSLLSGALVDPLAAAVGNTLASQLVGVTLAVGFDAYDPNFSSSGDVFGDLEILNGPHAGMTVSEFLSYANQVIGGCIPGDASELNGTASAINENYDNGNTDNGYLDCNPCPNCLRFDFTITSANISCYGLGNGSITLTTSGGTAPYFYYLNDVLVSTTNDSFYVFANLTPGAYVVAVNDSAGNSGASDPSITITQPDALSLTIAKTDITCYGGTGTATANVTGGTVPYSYSWNSIPVQTTQTATSLTAGTYTVSITDGNQCPISGSVTLVNLPCEGFTTITMGGYGAKCAGNNWGCYVKNNFPGSFPNGLTIGLVGRALKLTSAAAVEAFLPSGSTARALNLGTLINPSEKSYNNVLAGQTVALTLSVAFDANPNFSPSSTPLGSLIVGSGPFAGLTVNQLLGIANTILGGGASPYTASQINGAIDNVNRNYDNGNTNLGYLMCPCVSVSKLVAGAGELNPIKADFVVYPNPIKGNSTLDITLTYDSKVVVELYNINGQLVSSIYKGSFKADEKYSVNVDASKLRTGVYFLRISSDRETYKKSVLISE